MYPHRIRLRGPWDAAFAAEAVSVRLPDGWPRLVAIATGHSLRFTRRFGAPKLDADERVGIVVEGVTPSALLLNGQSLGIAGWVEITDRVLERNELELHCPAIGGPPEVALEIRGRAFFESLVLEPLQPAGCRVGGRIVGPADAPVELHVLSFGRLTHFEKVAGSPAGTSFGVDVVQLPDDAAPRAGFPAWRVELIEGPQVWHRADFGPG